MRASEEQLKLWMAGSLDGDAGAYTMLLGALAPLLRSFFGRRMFGAADDVEDLVQETLMAIHTRRATYDAHAPLRPGPMRSPATKWWIISAAAAARFR